MNPMKKLNTCVSSVSAWTTGQAKSSAIGAGPMAGTVMRRPTPGATRKLLIAYVRFDRAEVAEDDAVEHVVGGDRKEVLDRIEPLEVATDLHVARRRRCAAEVEAADRGETAGEEAVVDRRVVAGETEFRAGADHVPARVVGPFVDEKVFASVDLRRG